MHNFFFTVSFISCLYMFRAPCAHHQEGRIVLYSLWYHHTYRWPSHAQVERGLDQSSLNLCTGQPCIRVMIPEAVKYNSDLLMMSTWCLKHAEAWNKTYCKTKFCASSWLIVKINHIVENQSSNSPLWEHSTIINAAECKLHRRQRVLAFRMWCSVPVYVVPTILKESVVFAVKDQVGK